MKMCGEARVTDTCKRGGI